MATSLGADLLRASLFGAPRPRVAQHYEILAVLGRGASGVAVRAWDARLQRQVALKLMPATGTPTMMFNEGRALAQLSRPRHVVQVFEVGQSELTSLSFKASVDFVVMELIEGMSLRTWMATADPSHEATLSMLAGVAAGLADVHARNIVHGDVKPDNVVVDRSGVPLLVDFAFAVPESRDGGEAQGRIVGTASYMAPEALRGTRRRHSDVYSLGVMAWEALTGHHPFGDRAPRTSWLGVLEPLPLQREVPPRLRAILRRSLHPRPTHRPTSDDLWKALQVPPAPRRRSALRGWAASVVVALALLAVLAFLAARPDLRRALHRNTNVPANLLFAECSSNVPPCDGFVIQTRPSPDSAERCRAQRIEVPGHCTNACTFVGDNAPIRVKESEGTGNLPRPEGTYELTFRDHGGEFVLSRDGNVRCRGTFALEERDR